MKWPFPPPAFPLFLLWIRRSPGCRLMRIRVFRQSITDEEDSSSVCPLFCTSSLRSVTGKSSLLRNNRHLPSGPWNGYRCALWYDVHGKGPSAGGVQRNNVLPRRDSISDNSRRGAADNQGYAPIRSKMGLWYHQGVSGDEGHNGGMQILSVHEYVIQRQSRYRRNGRQRRKSGVLFQPCKRFH